MSILTESTWLDLPVRSGPVFCLLLRVSSDYAQPITGQVTGATCPVRTCPHVHVQHAIDEHGKSRRDDAIQLQCMIPIKGSAALWGDEHPTSFSKMSNNSFDFSPAAPYCNTSKFTLCMLAWRIFRTQNNFAEKYVIRSIIQFIVTISNRTEQWKIATGRGLRGMCNQSPNDYISGSLHSICPMAECWYSWQQQVEMPYDLWKDTICWSYTRQ